jgi:acetyltransferase-like isoleucine patch superfamily enzyme
MMLLEFKRRLSNQRFIINLWRHLKPRHRNDKFLYVNLGVHAYIVKDIEGVGNEVYISEGTKIDAAIIHIRGNHNIIKFGRDCIVGPDCSFWMEGNYLNIEIGDNCSFTQFNHFCAQENYVSIVIGDDCMISNHVIVRTSDSHPIYNIAGERTNPASSIFIGNHVWIAPESKIFKGVHIGDGCVIGSNSIVTKDIGPNCLAVGMPAKVVKEKIYWSRESLF